MIGMKIVSGIVWVGACCAVAQAADAPETQFKITSTLVQLDAVVTDAKGNRVTDLKPGEITVFEDGKPQRLTHFSLVTDGAATKPSPLPAAPLAESNTRETRRTIVLIVDDIGLSFEDMAFVRNALRKFVNEQLQPGDRVSICQTSGGSAVNERFTSDPKTLLANIDQVRWRTVAGVNGPRNLVGSPSSNATFFSMNYLIGALRDMPGRKAIVLFSEGMRTTVGSPQLANAIHRMLDRAYRAGVVLYTMQATGIVAEYHDVAEPEYQESLAYAAEQTGGFTLVNGNDLNSGLKRVLEDQTGYYVLGYHPPEGDLQPKPGAASFHRVRVELTRPGLRVHTRSGFFDGTDALANRRYETAAERLRDRMLSPFLSSGVELHLTALYAESPTEGAIVRNLLLIKGSDLTWKRDPRGGENTRITMAASASDADGEPLASIDRDFRIHIEPQDASEVMRIGTLYVFDVPVEKRGPYQMHVAVENPAAKTIGSATAFIEIPDPSKAGFALASIVLNEAHPARGDASSLGVESALRRFKRGSAIQFLSGIEKPGKNAPAPDIEAQVRLLHDGKEVYSAPAQLMDTKGGQRVIAGGLKIKDTMPAGDYNLQITAKSRTGGAGELAEQWTEFTVLPDSPSK